MGQTDKNNLKIKCQLTSDNGRAYCDTAAFIRRYSERGHRRQGCQECAAWEELPAMLYNPLRLLQRRQQTSCPRSQQVSPGRRVRWVNGKWAENAAMPKIQEKRHRITTMRRQPSAIQHWDSLIMLVVSGIDPEPITPSNKPKIDDIC